MQWVEQEATLDFMAVSSVSPDFSPRFTDVLCKKGFTCSAEVSLFLYPKLQHLEHPQAYSGVMDVAHKLAAAIRKGKRILVWGDYDVDGITSSAICFEVLRHYGADVQVHLPDRRTEGYGLNVPMIEDARASGVQTILTVDCGISDAKAVAHAKSMGMDVLVTDHHLPPAELPAADALCNPWIGEAPYNHLAGCGVAFYVMCALNKILSESGLAERMDPRSLLDLVALGTLADMVPLTGANRILVANGLKAIATPYRPGIRALKEVAGFEANQAMTAGQVVFALAPRINASGRMGSPRLAFELLCSTTLDEAMPRARKLQVMNSERQAEEDNIYKDALVQAEAKSGCLGLALYGVGWHPGIIGIVASRVVEKTGKPTIILSGDEKGLVRGSGRSVKGINLHQALQLTSSLLVSFGGHAAAAGLSMYPQHVEKFCEEFDKGIRAQCTGGSLPEVELRHMGELDFVEASNIDFARELEMLQPFGIGNAEPLFISPIVVVDEVKYFGKNNEHALLRLLDSYTGMARNVKMWRQADRMRSGEILGKNVRICYSPRLSEYNGERMVEFNVRDLQVEQ